MATTLAVDVLATLGIAVIVVWRVNGRVMWNMCGCAHGSTKAHGHDDQ